MEHDLDLRPQDLQILNRILEMHLPKEMHVSIFGSRANNTARRGSDLDLLIHAHRKLTQDELFVLKDAFDESDLPFRVDIIEELTVSDTFRALVAADLKSI